MIESTLEVNHRPEQSMEYHQKYFNAIKARDVKNAIRAMNDYLKAGELMAKQQ